MAATSNVDMKSVPLPSAPRIHEGRAGRRPARPPLQPPYRSSNVNTTATTVDAQAAYESVFSLWAVVMSGCNVVKHAAEAAGFEGGLVASFEKMVLDADLLQMVAEFLEPLEVSDTTLALDAIREVGPGGRFFVTPTAKANFRTAFMLPWSPTGTTMSWRGQGLALCPCSRSRDAAPGRVRAAAARPRDPRRGLDAYVARRTEEGGAPSEF